MTNTKKVIGLNLLIAGLTLFSILFIDKPLSFFIAGYLTSLQPFFHTFTALLDQFTNHIFWVLLFGSVLGVVLLFSSRTRKLAFVLLTLVFVHVAASILTNGMKTEFKRARPEVYLQTNGQSNDFYNEETKDYAFPSAHTSFYLSLFLPAALVFRRWALVLLVIPGIVILGRVVLNEHYLSDVLCSILIVINLCLLTLGIFNILGSRLKLTKTS